jgi:hypothetical protein
MALLVPLLCFAFVLYYAWWSRTAAGQ